MTEWSILEYLPFGLGISVLTWYLVKSSYVDLGLPLKHAITVGIARLMLVLLVCALMILGGVSILRLLPKTNMVTLFVFMLTIITSTYIIVKVDKWARRVLLSKLK